MTSISKNTDWSSPPKISFDNIPILWANSQKISPILFPSIPFGRKRRKAILALIFLARETHVPLNFSAASFPSHCQSTQFSLYQGKFNCFCLFNFLCSTWLNKKNRIVIRFGFEKKLKTPYLQKIPVRFQLVILSIVGFLQRSTLCIRSWNQIPEM